MKNKIALVTGGMGGIGTAICRSFHDQGATVIACYHRNAEAAKAWQLEEKNQGYDFQTIYADVGDFNSCAIMQQEIKTQYGTVEILVNNAGITRDAPCYKMSAEDWNKVMNTDLNSAFYVTRQFINDMIENHYGRIINISSINGQKGQFGQANYSTAKAGIHGFTKALALEVARKGITVNTISPGYIATEMVMSVPEKYREQIISQIPIGRLGKPEEIARMVSFLAAEESSFITGANFSINGGHYMI